MLPRNINADEENFNSFLQLELNKRLQNEK